MGKKRNTKKLRDRLTDYQQNERDKKIRKRKREREILEGVKRDKNKRWL